MMGFVRTPDQELFEDGTYAEQSVLDFAPGSIRRLAPGEEMQFFSPTRQMMLLRLLWPKCFVQSLQVSDAPTRK